MWYVITVIVILWIFFHNGNNENSGSQKLMPINQNKMEEIVEIEMPPRKKEHSCNGYSVVQNGLGYTPDWCDGTIKYDQPYISIHIKDDSGIYTFHDCKRCHEYIKAYNLDLIEV